MAKILGFALLIIVIVAGFFYFRHQKGLQDPVVQYQNIIRLPTAEQADAFKKTLQGWIKDPSSAIPYPKGWRKVTLTKDGQTFEAVTSDDTNPPEYYASFKFPKVLIPTMHIIKCVGTGATKTTDICVVGDNPALNAYFNFVDWFKKNPISNPPSTTTVAP